MASGRSGSIGIGPETTWGQGVASSAFFTATENITEDRGRLRESFIFGSRSAAPADAGRLRIDGGTISDIHARPENLGHLLRAALGVPTTTDLDPNFEHVFTPAAVKFSALAALPPYSVNIKRGNKVNRYSGAQLSRLELRQPKDDALMLNTTWLAKGVSEIAAETQSLESGTRFLYRQLEVTRDGIIYPYLEDFTLTVDNGLEAEEVLNETDEISAVDFGSNSSIEASITLTFRDAVTYNDFANNVAKPWGFRWEIDAETFLDIAIPRLNISKWSAPISGPGRMTLSVSAQAEYSTQSGTDLTVTLGNQVAAY